MQITTVRASEYITLLVCHFLHVEQKLLNYPFETSKNFLEIEQEIRLHVFPEARIAIINSSLGIHTHELIKMNFGAIEVSSPHAKIVQ